MKKVDYYDKIYGRLSNTLKDASVHLMTKDGKQFLEREDETAFYNEGLKQMISHYIGVTTEISTERLNASDKKIALGEVLFNFGDRVPICADKYKSYKMAYTILKKGLECCAKEDSRVDYQPPYNISVYSWFKLKPSIPNESYREHS